MEFAQKNPSKLAERSYFATKTMLLLNCIEPVAAISNFVLDWNKMLKTRSTGFSFARIG